MQSRLAAIVATLDHRDSIYAAPGIHDPQDTEVVLRKRKASQDDDYLKAIARNHAVPVMDREIDRFLERIPEGGIVIDIGGCWGWHWRRLATTRPDVGVLVVDYVRENLEHAIKVLGPMVGDQVALLHADATHLPIADEQFDGAWSVQTLCCIPDYEGACREAYRVLAHGAIYDDYSLNSPVLARAVYAALGRRYHVEGVIPGAFYLTRATDRHKGIVESVFGTRVDDRYTEWLFNPDLKLVSTGRADSLVGKVDARLAGLPWLGKYVARQRTFEARKA